MREADRDLPLVEIRGLSKTYSDGKRALEAVDLDIEEGMLGLLGPNGAGKTTFLSMLVLALEPTSGSRVYAGLDAGHPRDRPRIRGLIGYLPQDFAPVPYLTGHEYLVHCARLRRVPLRASELERRAHDLLAAVSLERAASRRAGEYSGGMKRRLGIAQALIHRPRLVVVDEPTAGLDPEERIRFRNLIADVAEETAVLLSTHIVEDVEATCPRLVVIARGRLLFDGPPSRLFSTAARSAEPTPRAPGGAGGAAPPPNAAALGECRPSGSGDPDAAAFGPDSPGVGAFAAAAATPPETLEGAYLAFLSRHGIAPAEASG